MVTINTTGILIEIKAEHLGTLDHIENIKKLQQSVIRAIQVLSANEIKEEDAIYDLSEFLKEILPTDKQVERAFIDEDSLKANKKAA